MAACTTGGDAVVQNVFGPITTDVVDFAVAPEEFIASGDTVAVVVRYSGTGKTTGKELDLVVVHVWDVRDGKIARFRQFADTARFWSSYRWRSPQPHKESDEYRKVDPSRLTFGVL